MKKSEFIKKWGGLFTKEEFENEPNEVIAEAQEEAAKCTHPKEALAYWQGETFCVRCQEVVAAS